MWIQIPTQFSNFIGLINVYRTKGVNYGINIPYIVAIDNTTT